MSALATDQRRLFAGTSAGIAVFDVSQERWLDPITAEDGFPVAADPTALAYDPLADELWMATVNGGLFSYSSFFGRWEDEGSALAPPVFEIAFSRDATGSVFVRDSRGWSLLERGSFQPRPLPRGVSPPPRGSVDPLDDPLLRSRGRTLTVDETGRSWPVTDALTLIGSPDVWIASYGGYVFRYSDFAADTRHYVYGIPGRGVASVLVTPDAIWFGGDARTRRQGVARSDHSLDRWLQWEGSLHGAPAGRVRDMVESGGRLWAAAADGLYFLDPGSGRWSRLGVEDGLPDAAALSLAPTAGGVWAGTRRGAVSVDAGGVAGQVVAPGLRVAGLTVAGGDLWLATDAGVLRAVGAAAGEAATDLARLADGDPRLGARSFSIATLDGAVYAAFDDAVRRVDRPGSPTPPLSGGGSQARLRAAGGRLWLAGAEGLRGWDPRSGDLVRYDVGNDIPVGPVSDVGVGAGGVWAATPVGALLIRAER
ncbi:MAG TPA: hypothetical protein VML95_09565 [Longimicrobiales bacterium]|nr:hypothetical protein [Longimicrobiales bacterium]